MAAVATATVRLTDRLFAQLNALASERGVTRTRLVRQLLEASVQGRPAPPTGTLSEEDLLDLLTEKARQGNVSAIRSLLLREEQADPGHRALLAFEQIAAERRQLVAATLIGEGAVCDIERAAHDREPFRALVELAETASSSGLVALDLVSAISVQRAGP